MSTYDFEPDPDDFGPEPAYIANYVGARRDSRIESGAKSLPTTPDQARKYANGMVPNSTVATMLRSLAEQVETLTAERDEWKARCEFSFEQRDKLTVERDALTAKVASFESRIDRHVKTELALIVNNKSLRDAARLALGALTTAHINVLDDMLADEIQQVIAALKAVL